MTARRQWYAPDYATPGEEPGALALALHFSELDTGDGPSLEVEVRAVWVVDDVDLTEPCDWWRGSPLLCWRGGAFFRSWHGEPAGWLFHDDRAEPVGGGLTLRECRGAVRVLSRIEKRRSRLVEKWGSPRAFRSWLPMLAESVGVAGVLVPAGTFKSDGDGWEPGAALRSSPYRRGALRLSPVDAACAVERFASHWATARRVGSSS